MSVYTIPDSSAVLLNFKTLGYAPPISERVILEFQQDVIIGSVDDCVHGQTFTGNLTLTQVHNLIVQALTNGQTTGSVLLTQVHNLLVSTLFHAQALDPITLTQAHNLSVLGVSHATSLDGLLDLVQNITLVINGLSHAQTLDSLIISLHLVVEGLLHAQSLGVVTLSQVHNLTVQALLHAERIQGGLKLTQVQFFKEFAYKTLNLKEEDLPEGDFAYGPLSLRALDVSLGEGLGEDELGEEPLGGGESVESDFKYKKVN